MDLLKSIDWSKINEAYQLFVNTGRILPGVVRPQVIESWQRCQSLNPWTSRPNPVSDEQFNEVLNDNADLVEFARPVMQYMYATNNRPFWDNFVQLGEKGGIVLECITRCAYPNPLKKRISEATIGTSITSLVLVLQTPVELGGSEQYKVCYQSCFGGAAPVKDSNGNFLGVLSLYNNYGKIPDQPLEFVITAAKLIENLLNNKAVARKNTLVANEYFTKMINFVDDCIVVVDQNGNIINFNSKFKELAALDGKAIAGRHCREFGIEPGTLTADSAGGNKDHFHLKTSTRNYSCLLQNDTTVKWNNQEHTLLLFSVAEPPKVRTKVAVNKQNIDTLEKIVGRSTCHEKMIHLIKRAAEVSANVLVCGESGTGKEVFSRAIHNASARASKPFVALNCGAFSPEIMQSELFGYEEGAFTGGRKGGQIGKFEAADGGTLLLDEIGEMPLNMQVSLLRFLQDKTVTRVGGYRPKKVDVRIIAATNRNLREHVAKGLFREDLYYRLKVIQVTIPPLRSRKDDILLLAAYYADYYADIYSTGKITLAQETKDYLYQYNWPGNIRELANAMENAVIFSEKSQITPDLLPSEILEYQPGVAELSVDGITLPEKEIIARALNAARGNVSNAARAVGISRNTMYRKIDKYGLRHSK